MAVTPDEQRIFVVGERRSSERPERLAELRWDGARFRIHARWPVPVEITEVESLAWLGSNRILLGTEDQTRAAREVLYIGDLGGKTVRWTTSVVDYKKVWGDERRRPGRGIEAACGALGIALIGRERVLKTDGAFRLQLAWADASSLENWSAVYVDLPLDDTRLGLSSLSCQEGAYGSIVAWAILRDTYAGRFVVRMVLPPRPPVGYIAKAYVAEAACFDDRNAEAIGIIGDELFVMTDGATGTPGSWLFRSHGSHAVMRPAPN